MFSSFELHRVSTLLSGLIRYSADFSTPVRSSTGVACAAGAAAAGWAGLTALGSCGGAGLTSGPAWESAVTVMVVMGVPPAPAPPAPCVACHDPSERRAIEPPSAAA